jgi:hypothetical protein
MRIAIDKHYVLGCNVKKTIAAKAILSGNTDRNVKTDQTSVCIEISYFTSIKKTNQIHHWIDPMAKSKLVGKAVMKTTDVFVKIWTRKSLCQI